MAQSSIFSPRRLRFCGIVVYISSFLTFTSGFLRCRNLSTSLTAFCFVDIISSTNLMLSLKGVRDQWCNIGGMGNVGRFGLSAQSCSRFPLADTFESPVDQFCCVSYDSGLRLGSLNCFSVLVFHVQF